jgi:hypothetical protein
LPVRNAPLFVVLLVTCAATAPAQVRDAEDTVSAGEGAGILSDVSTNVGHDSRPVHDGTLTIGETSSGPIRSGPVSDAQTRSMLSGPVSSISQGPMRQTRPPLSGGSMTEASAGAVKHDAASPLGERISDPLRELGPLQEQMRARRQRAEDTALAGAAEPAVPRDAVDPPFGTMAPLDRDDESAMGEPQAHADEEAPGNAASDLSQPETGDSVEQ